MTIIKTFHTFGFMLSDKNSSAVSSNTFRVIDSQLSMTGLVKSGLGGGRQELMKCNTASH